MSEKTSDYDLVMMKAIAERIILKAEEAIAEDSGDEFDSGKRMAYFEIIDSLQNMLEVYGYSLEDMDFVYDPMKLIKTKK